MHSIPKIQEYQDYIKSIPFKEMEDFSNSFLTQHKKFLDSYSKRWVVDPLHQWSRQWEYPFVYNKIVEYLEHKNIGDKHIKILDAGSGVTFFPYYLSGNIKNSEVICCDFDTSLKEIYNLINQNTSKNIQFDIEDIHKLSYQDNEFDIVYCISVLEHLKDYEKVIKEFKRILKPNGLMIITMDISLDGDSDIPVDAAYKLIKCMDDYFPGNSNNVELTKELLSEEDIITTKYFCKNNPKLLPWKYPYLTYAKSILKLKPQKNLIKNLTFYCTTYEKK